MTDRSCFSLVIEEKCLDRSLKYFLHFFPFFDNYCRVIRYNTVVAMFLNLLNISM
jgi:hypothetical protein